MSGLKWFQTTLRFAGESMASWRLCGAPKTPVPRGKPLDQRTTRRCNDGRLVRNTLSTFVAMQWESCQSDCHHCWHWKIMAELQVEEFHHGPLMILMLQHVSPVLWFGSETLWSGFPGNGPCREEDPEIVLQRATSRRIKNAHQKCTSLIEHFSISMQFLAEIGGGVVVFDCRDWWT